MAWYGRSSGFCRTLLRSFERYKTPLLDGSRRFFHYKVQKNPRKCLLGCWFVTSLYYWNVERVPFSNRSHFMLFPTSLERELGNLYFEEDIKPKYEGKILPPLHPLTVRVQRIGQEIVEAARKGLKKEEEFMLVKLFKKLGKSDYDQIPEFDWEFFVVYEPICNAECHPGGKLVIFTGFTDIFESDAEIAATIEHEVGLARHTAENCGGSGFSGTGRSGARGVGGRTRGDGVGGLDGGDFSGGGAGFIGGVEGILVVVAVAMGLGVVVERGGSSIFHDAR